MKFTDAINEIRNRVNIVDVISKSVRLKRAGNNYMGLCPFHNDHHPSFCVSESKQIFKCFVCGKGGNVYTFLQEHEGLTFPEAVKVLAKQVNITIDDDFKQNNELSKKRDIMHNLYKDVANEYYKILYNDKGKNGLNYLIKRNLTKETIKKFGLGFAPNEFGYMYRLMKDKGYSDEVLMDSKLFFLSDKGPYDFFYDRVMFPLVDSFGNVVSFQGRVLSGDNQKYINTASSIIYNKSKHLFAINYASKTKRDYYILCEGNMDAITLHQAGFDNAIASWGTAFTIEQANLIKRKVKKVYLCQDTDDAGVKAIESAASICSTAGIETYVIDLNPVKDADEFINKYGVSEFSKKLEKPIPSFLFLISILRKKFDLKNSYDYEKYINTIVARLSDIDNTLVRDKYIKDVALQENLSYEDLIRQVEKNITGGKIIIKDADTNAHNSNNYSNILNAEKLFLSIIIEYPQFNNQIFDIINVNELHSEASIYIYNKYKNNTALNEIADFSNELRDEVKDEVQSIIFDKENLLSSVNNENVRSIINELIRKIKKHNLITDEKIDLKSTLENNKKIIEIDNTIFIS